jgi:hypothetical protein
VVVGPSMVEVVRFAGGWVFDRVLAGWDVTVLTADFTDPRPLRILGARAADLESAVAVMSSSPRPQAIAVEAGLYDTDSRVRRVVRDAIDQGLTDVRLWDSRRPEQRDGGACSVRHRLSVAARAFKAHALAAAAVPVDSIDVTEMFHSGESDLVPAA